MIAHKKNSSKYCKNNCVLIYDDDLLGTPDTNLSGRSTLNARNALTSNPSICISDNIVLIILKRAIFIQISRFFVK